jgi:hypothetical protein
MKMESTEAILWIHDKKCRVLLKEDGVVVDKNDTWNNRASAEHMVRTSAPEATIRFIKTTPESAPEIEKLNVEWSGEDDNDG